MGDRDLEQCAIDAGIDGTYWSCEHCGERFSVSQDTCSCGAMVDEDEGVAQMPDRHSWDPPGARRCRICAGE